MNYESFFNFKEKPFTQSPDTDFYFSSEAHKEAMQHLLYCIRSDDGFIKISGHPGTGKTITIRSLLKQVAGENVNVSYIVNSKAGPEDILNAVALDFGLDSEIIDNNIGEQLLRLLHQHLVQLNEEGTIPIIIIDEAQNLRADTLEQLCLISNLETEKKKLVKIILVGQLELDRRLNKPEFQKIYNRITVRYQIKPLSKTEMNAYIQYRIRIASESDSQVGLSPFTPIVLNQIYRYSKGIPRIINTICDRALMAAFIDNTREVTPIHVKKAMKSLIGESTAGRHSKRTSPIRVGILSLILLALIYVFFQLAPQEDQSKSIPIELSIKNKNAKLDAHKNTSSPAEEKQDITPTTLKKETTVTKKTEKKEIKAPDQAPIADKKLSATTQASQPQHLTNATDLITPDSLVVIFTPNDNKMVVWKGQMNLSLLNQTTDQSVLKLQSGEYFIGKETTHESEKKLAQSMSDENEHDSLPDEPKSLSITHMDEISDDFDPSFLMTDDEYPLTNIFNNDFNTPEKAEITSVNSEPVKIEQETEQNKAETAVKLKKKKKLMPKKSKEPDKSNTKQIKKETEKINLFPQEMLFIPQGKVVVMISPDVNRLFVWKGTSTHPKFVHQVPMDIKLKEGIYIIGREKGRRPFMFHPEPSYSVSQKDIDRIWEDISKKSLLNIIPIIVSASEKVIPKTFINRGKQVPKLVHTWVEAWRVKDFYKYMNCYNKKIILFYKTDKPPITLAWDVLKNSQAKIFSGKTQRIITISEPVCLLDPENPKEAVAIFNQEHSDDNYSESGVKVLYLKRARDNDNVFRWKINGRIWIQGAKMMETIP